MKVYLFSDFLKTIHGDPLDDSQVICEIDDINEFPRGIISINGENYRSCSMGDGFLTIEFIGEIPEEDDVYGANEITCPHCGSEESDSWEASDSDDRRSCGDCGSLFSYERIVDVTYSSTILERNCTIQKLD